MNRRVGDVRRKRRVERAAAAENRLPGCAAVGRAEDVVVAATAMPAIKCAGDEHLRIMRIDRGADVSKSFVARSGLGLLGCYVSPLARFGIELPHRAIWHAPGSRHRAICNEEISVGSQHGAMGPVLRGLAGYGLPALAAVGAAEEILAAE